MLNRTLSKICLVISLFYGFSAQAITITWQDETFTDVSGVFNNNNFDDGFVTFSPFQAASLDDVAGTGIYHSHGFTRTFELSILLDGIWTGLFADTVTSGINTPVDSIPTPIAFTPGAVSGIRFSVDQPVGQAFHLAFGAPAGDTQFVFGNGTTAVPEPAALALLCPALLAVGLFARKRKAKVRTGATI